MPGRRLVRDPQRYKTTPCRNGWNAPWACPYNWKCQHAHCEAELRVRSPSKTYTPPPPPPSTVQSPVSIITTEVETTVAPSSFQLNMPPLPIGPPPPLSASPSLTYWDDKKATPATPEETTSDENDVETLCTECDDIEPFITSKDTNRHNEPASTSDDTDDTNETLDYLDSVLATYRRGE